MARRIFSEVYRRKLAEYKRKYGRKPSIPRYLRKRRLPLCKCGECRNCKRRRWNHMNRRSVRKDRHYWEPDQRLPQDPFREAAAHAMQFVRFW